MSFDPRLGSKCIFAFLLLVVSKHLFPIWGVYDNDIIRTLGVMEPYGHKSSRQRDSCRSSWIVLAPSAGPGGSVYIAWPSNQGA